MKLLERINIPFNFSPKIMHKGLALFVVPVVLNGVWIGLLVQSLAHSQALIAQERQHSDNIDHLNNAMEMMFDATSNMFSYMFSNDTQYRDLSQKYINQFRSESEIIMNGMAFNQTERASSLAIADQFDGFLQQLTPVDASAEFDPLVKFRSIRRQMRHIFSQSGLLAAQLRHTLDAQKLALEESRRQENKTRAAVNDIVTKGMVANLLIASLLSFFFLKDISQKLNVLVENARRLPKRLSLEEPLSGSDELSYLDEAMHIASDDLQKAFDHRASLMQMVAHDLRSPLTSAQISLDLIQATEAETLSPKSFKHIERIGSNNRMVLDLINDLLTIDALELGTIDIFPVRVAVRTMTEEAVTAIAGIASLKKIEIDDFSENEYVSADSKRIVQVLINLLSNALKFSPSGSQIKIVTSREANFIEIAVVDKGVGMSETDCRMVFDKFYQASEGKAADGFGLGLAICKLIVTSHGGQIGVTSELKRGSRFWFRLKAAQSNRT